MPWSPTKRRRSAGVQTNVSWPFARRATMGYKGIQGQYLPSGTVPMQTYQSPGAKDFNFHY